MEQNSRRQVKKELEQTMTAPIELGSCCIDIESRAEQRSSFLTGRGSASSGVETKTASSSYNYNNYVNSLSSREMKSLTAICDTFLPSLGLDDDDDDDSRKAAGDTTDQHEAIFYRSSASMAGTPERVGGLICERLEHPKKWLIRVSLWLLSTWIGTFILYGGLRTISFSLSSGGGGIMYFLRVGVQFHSFSEIPDQRKREEILHCWSLSFYYPLRMLFKVMKLLTLLVFFSQVDERYENLTWNAIGYPGPDPHFFKSVHTGGSGSISRCRLLQPNYKYNINHSEHSASSSTGHHRLRRDETSTDDDHYENETKLTESKSIVDDNDDYEEAEAVAERERKELQDINATPDREKEVDEVHGPLHRGILKVTSLPIEIAAASLRLSGFQAVSIHSVPRTPSPIPKTTTTTAAAAATASSFKFNFNQRNNNIINSKNHPCLVIRCDAVVVGSGSGGGVVAGVLANAGYKVLVLEKGSYLARSNLSLLEGPSMDQMYLSGGLMATDDVGVVLLAGSTVGGGSAVNWSASIKTPQQVMKEWSNSCGLRELFDSQLYREALEVVCQKMGVQSEIEEEGFNNAILRRGCEALGFPVNNIPRNSAPDHNCGWCCFGCKDGRKKATSETWLVDLVNSGNGAILPGCEAVKVLHRPKPKRIVGSSASSSSTKEKDEDKEEATGVVFEFNHKGKGGKVRGVVETTVTIIACGALSTPVLLKRSGLKNPNIGRHLHLHPVTMAWGYFPIPEAEEEEAEASASKSFQGAIMTAMSTVVANFDKSESYGAVIQTPSLHPGMFASSMPWVSGSDMKRRIMRRYSRTAHIFALARDRGSGTVNSHNSISYKMEAGDEEILQRGVEKMLRILAAAGAEEIGTHHWEGKTMKLITTTDKRTTTSIRSMKKDDDDEEEEEEDQQQQQLFERFVKEESSRGLRDLSTQICSAHQMGSCRMGVDPKHSVVNKNGETWEVEGLYLADTSVFPTALGVNPMVTVQAIAYCTAHSILHRLLNINEF